VCGAGLPGRHTFIPLRSGSHAHHAHAHSEGDWERTPVHGRAKV